MNIEESGLLDVIVGMKNVLCWHQIIDRKAKLTLGRQWQVCAEQEQTRFFMVFKKWDFGLDGANTVEEFVEILRELRFRV